MIKTIAIFLKIDVSNKYTFSLKKYIILTDSKTNLLNISIDVILLNKEFYNFFI